MPPKRVASRDVTGGVERGESSGKKDEKNQLGILFSFAEDYVITQMRIQRECCFHLFSLKNADKIYVLMMNPLGERSMGTLSFLRRWNAAATDALGTGLVRNNKR